MRILILTQYFLPETGAPQNRLAGLATGLKREGFDVEILTAMPNYPKMMIHDAYRGKIYFRESLNGLTIHRSWIYASTDRGIISRLMNYFSFVFSSMILSTRVQGTFDFVLCESPPLFLGISAVNIARRKKARLIFNVSDLWPESAEKLKIISNRNLLELAYRLEGWIYRNSALITGQTKGICKNISDRYPSSKTHWLPNGIDRDRFETVNYTSEWRKEHNFVDDDFLVYYGGIFGHAQGLKCIIEAAMQLRDNKKIRFILVGDGPEKEEIIKMKSSLNADNVFIYDTVDRDRIPAVIAAMDAGIIPLKKLDLFRGAIPSKIFEILALEKPVILGVTGEAKELFIDDGKCGLAYEPENSGDLAKQILALFSDRAAAAQFGKNGRDYVMRNFERTKITGDFISRLATLK